MYNYKKVTKVTQRLSDYQRGQGSEMSANNQSAYNRSANNQLANNRSIVILCTFAGGSSKGEGGVTSDKEA